MSGETQLVLVMLGGLVGLMMWMFRYVNRRLDQRKVEIRELSKVIGQQGTVLAALAEVNRKMEQWYYKNIPELHCEVKRIQHEMSKAQSSIARLKVMNLIEAEKLKEKDGG